MAGGWILLKEGVSHLLPAAELRCIMFIVLLDLLNLLYNCRDRCRKKRAADVDRTSRTETMEMASTSMSWVSGERCGGGVVVTELVLFATIV